MSTTLAITAQKAHTLSTSGGNSQGCNNAGDTADIATGLERGNPTIKPHEVLYLYKIAAFPSEIKDIYFIKDVINKSPKGKLYCKYFNTIRCMRQNRLIPTIEKEPKIETESENVANYLSNHDMTWPEIEEIWRKTINYRLQFIKKYNTAEIFNKWQHYTKPMRYKLIDIDFHKIYSRYSCYITKFEEASSKLIKILDEGVKDCESKTNIEKLKNTPNLSNSKYSTN
ncbi:hypothetical protein AGLY_018051 [Aphis glycines]|uniref:Uncharacterized protein n=1 Tax=Aphis glycines TaxID=307491 RepID=A0A6G0SV19_APHGL|nr:hypothetical protein AGLY_018051 [Aphis glycines]